MDLYELMWPKTYHFLFPLVLTFLRVQLLQQVPHFGIQFFVAVLQLLNWHLIKSKRDRINRKYIHTGLHSPLAFNQCTNSGGVRSRDGPHWTYGITFGTGIGYSWMLSSHMALQKYVERIFWASGYDSGLKADWPFWLVDPSCTRGHSSWAMPFVSFTHLLSFLPPPPFPLFPLSLALIFILISAMVSLVLLLCRLVRRYGGSYIIYRMWLFFSRIWLCSLCSITCLSVPFPALAQCL